MKSKTESFSKKERRKRITKNHKQKNDEKKKN
jgi:hypothetical protein